MTLLTLSNLTVRRGDCPVVDRVSLTVQAGEFVAIMGASGSGKSTLLRCINLLEKPNTGRIVLSGEELQLKADRHGELQAVSAAQLQRLRTKLAMAVHSPEIIAAYHDAIPLNRYGSEQEIAEVIHFLCSDRASYVTGQLIAADGGFESTGIGLPALRE